MLYLSTVESVVIEGLILRLRPVVFPLASLWVYHEKSQCRCLPTVAAHHYYICKKIIERMKR